METRNRNHILLRYALVIVGVLVFSIAIIKKAADTCIIHADKWNEKAAGMLSVTHEVMPERGDILAQNGEVLATNMTYYRALIDFGVPKFKKKEFNDSLPTMCESELNTLWFEISAQQRMAGLEDNDEAYEMYGHKLDLIDEQLEYLDHEADMVKEYEEQKMNKYN